MEILLPRMKFILEIVCTHGGALSGSVPLEHAPGAKSLLVCISPRSMAVLSSRAHWRRSREKNLLQPQSPRGFSALARLYYLARTTTTAMLRRLCVSAFRSHKKDDSQTWQSYHAHKKMIILIF